MKINVIYAQCLHEGRKLFGDNKGLPWKCKKDMEFFKYMTKDKILLCGYQTYRELQQIGYKNLVLVNSSEEIKRNLQFNLRQQSYKEIFLIGGNKMINKCFNEIPQYIQDVYVTNIPQRYLNKNIQEKVYIDIKNHPRYLHNTILLGEDDLYVQHYKYMNTERQYLDILLDVMKKGEKQTSRNGNTYNLYGQHLNIPCYKDKLSIFNHRKIFLRGAIEEALFFIKGQSDIKILQDKGINFWNGNVSQQYLNQLNLHEMDVDFLQQRKNTDLGAVYGVNLRKFSSNYKDLIENKNTVDQLRNLIKDIETDKYSRRHMITMYNPFCKKYSLIPPCHNVIHILNIYRKEYIDDNQCFIGDVLDITTINRSSDLILGLPMNIIFSQILMKIICKHFGFQEGNIHMSIANAHIYEDHIHQIKERIYEYYDNIGKIDTVFEFQRKPNVWDYEYSDFTIKDYKYKFNDKYTMNI